MKERGRRKSSEKTKNNSSESRIEKQRDGNARNGRSAEKKRKREKIQRGKWLNLTERKETENKG